MKWMNKIVILSFLEFVCVLCQYKYTNQIYGETCYRHSDNATGSCEYFDECPQIRIDSQNKVPLTTCLIGNPPIVCCIEKRRISDRKCDEYKKLANRRNCITQNTSQGNTLQGEFPHMVFIHLQGADGVSMIGAGTLISDKFVLTAVNYLETESYTPTYVVLGESQKFGIKKLIKHPKHDSISSYNDIGLIEIDGRASFTEFVRPACLWQDNAFTQSKVVTASWVSGDEVNLRLLKITLSTLSNRDCQKYFPEDSYSDIRLLDSQLCAAYLKNGRLVKNTKICTGNEGSPIHVETIQNSCKIFTVVGVASLEVACGFVSSPSVYTKVSSYLDWIESVVWN